MQYKTKLSLAAVQQLCDAKDKSTEHMIQLMQDICNVSHNTVMNYLEISQSEKSKLFKEVIAVVETVSKLDKI